MYEDLIEKIKAKIIATQNEDESFDGHFDSAQRHGKVLAYKSVLKMIEEL